MVETITQHQFQDALEAGNYRQSDRLQSWEMALLVKQAHEAMCTTNGDTGPVTLTARQFYILLRAAVLSETCMAPKSTDSYAKTASARS